MGEKAELMMDQQTKGVPIYNKTVLHFGPYQLEGVKRLWCEDELLETRPRSLTVLRYLAERQGRVVSSDELLHHLRPGICVTRTMLHECISELRHVLQDNPTTPQFIEAIGRQGYRFIAPLTATSPVRES